MGSNWKNIPLGNLITLQRGHDLPSQDRTEGCVPIMGSSGLTGWHNEVKMTGPGVVVGRSGNSMGVVSYSDSDFWPLNTCLYVTDFKGNDVRYIYYLLQQIDFDQFNSGSAQKSLNRNAVYPFEVYSTEDKDEQRAIAKLLSDFEEKVALNNQINQTLEQMAQTLFKSWFVDFDPVKAKMNGEQPKGMDAATASLFPEKLVESELGLIPEGWEASKLEDLVDIASSKRVFAKEYLKEGVPFYRGKEITELSKGNSVTPEIYISEERYQELKDKAGAPKKGDILITSVGTIGNTYLVDLEDKFYFKDGNLTWVRGYKGEEIPYFLMEWFNSAVGKCAVENIKIGSTQQAITIKSLNGIKLVSPPNDIHMKFTQLIEPLYRKHRANIKQSKALANLRDTLLPKLLSGEIDLENVQVKEVKAIVE
ncbi:restriction endonuclease subunit S [Vibrio splendidus]